MVSNVMVVTVGLDMRREARLHTSAWDYGYGFGFMLGSWVRETPNYEVHKLRRTKKWRLGENPLADPDPTTPEAPDSPDMEEPFKGLSPTGPTHGWRDAWRADDDDAGECMQHSAFCSVL